MEVLVHGIGSGISELLRNTSRREDKYGRSASQDPNQLRSWWSHVSKIALVDIRVHQAQEAVSGTPITMEPVLLKAVDLAKQILGLAPIPLGSFGDLVNIRRGYQPLEEGHQMLTACHVQSR